MKFSNLLAPPKNPNLRPPTPPPKMGPKLTQSPSTFPKNPFSLSKTPLPPSKKSLQIIKETSNEKSQKSQNSKNSQKTLKNSKKKNSYNEIFRNDLLSENILVTLPSEISINDNKFFQSKGIFGPNHVNLKQVHRHKGDHQSIIFSQNYSKLSKFWNRSEKSDPITKLLKGGFKQIKKNKDNKGMVIINFKTDIDKPDPERLEKFLKQYTLRDSKGNKFSFWDALCHQDNGSMFFCKKKQKTIFDKSGPGVSLYFIFLKTMMFFFFIASILSIFLLSKNRKTYNTVLDQSETQKATLSTPSLANFLVSTTTSIISGMTISTYGIILEKSKKTKISLSCEFGKITTNFDYTQFGITYTSRSPHEVNNVFDVGCTNWGSFVDSLRKCEGESFCEVEYRPSWLKKDCQKDQVYDDMFGVVKLYCKDAKVDGVLVRKFYIPYFMICFGIVLIFQGFLIWLYLNEKLFMKQYGKKFRSPNEYALQLRGIPSDWNETELITAVYNLFKKFQKEQKMKSFPLVDIQIAHSKKLLILTNKGEELKQKIQLIMIKVKKNLKMNLPTSHMFVDKFQNRLRTAIIFANKDGKKRIKSQFKHLEQIKILNSELNRVKSRLFKIANESDDIKSVFITFNTIKDKIFFKGFLEYKWSHRCKKLIFCKKKVVDGFKESNIYAEEPPQPININWENYSYVTREKVERRVLSWLIYILMYSIPVLTLLYFAGYKRTLTRQLPTCNNEIKTDNFLNLTEQQLKCLCLSSDSTLLKENLQKLGYSSDFCTPIEESSSKLSMISIIESIIMSLISVIFDFLYRYLSNFEVHNDSNDTKNSLVKKLFFWKYFTTAIIPVFSGIHIPALGDHGFYDEVTPNWFREKGTSIMISSILRIFILAGVGIVRYLIPKFIVWYDSFWTMDKNKTRKSNHKDYEDVYKTDEFDLELSYAEACTTIYLAMTYGFFMPSIFFSSYLQLLALYFRDKLLNANTYMFFSFFGKKMNKFARNLLNYSFTIALFVCVWVFGNIDYFPSVENNIEKMPEFRGEEIDITTFNYDFELLGAPKRNPGYANTLIRRLNATSLGRVVFIAMLIYAGIIVVKIVVYKLDKIFKQKLLKKGVEKFEKELKDSETKFVNLVHQNDIVYSKSLAKLLKGSEIPNKEVQEMHKNRLKEFTKSLKRKIQKEKLVRSLEEVNVDIYAGKLKTLRLGSVDLDLENEFSDFLTLSSYDHKLHPNFRGFYIKKALDKVIEDGDDIDIDNVTKKVLSNFGEVSKLKFKSGTLRSRTNSNNLNITPRNIEVEEIKEENQEVNIKENKLKKKITEEIRKSVEGKSKPDNPFAGLFGK